MIKIKNIFVCWMFIPLTMMGCQMAQLPKAQKESSQEVEKALESMAGVMNGKPLTADQMHELKKQIVTDKQARSAVESITHSMGVKIKVKYCPVGGERYSARLDLCPVHHVLLKPVEE